MSSAPSTAASAAAHAAGPSGVSTAPPPPRVRALTRPDASWDALLICIAGYILVAVGRVHQVFPALDVIRPVILTGACAILLFLFDAREDRRLALVAGGTSKWLLVFFGCMVLSIPGALVGGQAFDLVFNNYIKTVVMFFVVAASVRGGRDLERLAGAYLFGCAVYAAVVLVRFDVGGTDWRLGLLYYYDANDFATFAVTAMPLAVYFAHRGRRFLVKALAVLALGLLCAAFVNSGSRGGFLALLAAGGFVMFRYSAIPLGRRLVAFAAVGVVLLVVASDRYWEQMGSILSDTDYNQTEESGRLQIWQRGIGYMVTHPVFGVGAGNFEVAEGTISSFAERQQFGVGVRWNAPHNSFIQVGAELGIAGLIVFVVLVFGTLAGFLRLSRYGRARPLLFGVPPELAQALAASLIGFVVGAFFLSLAYSELLCMLLAFGVAAQKVARLRRPVLVSKCA